MSKASNSWEGRRLLLEAGKILIEEVRSLTFSDPVTHVYNPLEYAWKSHETYLTRFASPDCRVILFGMNPGPWGMSQTGIPFGEVEAVRDWMGIEEVVGKPENEHPKRQIEGFACARSEVSGRRLWGLFAEKFGAPEKFFKSHLVLNHCPLVFMEASGKNRTPDKLPAVEAAPLMEACDRHLRRVVEILKPEFVVGVGAYAEKRAMDALEGIELSFSRILHPSPASPAANRDWAGTASKQLIEAGIWES
ncbi:MAG: uracil-DNA glycosylase family protein [Verrucomicrobiota bacterium]